MRTGPLHLIRCSQLTVTMPGSQQTAELQRTLHDQVFAAAHLCALVAVEDAA